MLCQVSAQANHEFIYLQLLFTTTSRIFSLLWHIEPSLNPWNIFGKKMRIRTRLLDMSEAFSLNGANLLRVFYPMIPKVFPNRTPGGKKQSDGQMMDKGWPSEDQVMTKRWSRFCKLWPSLTGFLQVARGAIQGPSGCFQESKIPTLRFSVSLPCELFLPLFPTSPFCLSGCTIIPISVSICPWA